ncbi:hypothetical protein GCM10022224_036310 [Nonomuraea antimicrobica]|uniref:Uncharacterized protein n=1 Tax=Nonomuraea antimicrobica TaxID=561173 RepID=A0ABP7BVR4_9ACTN
MLLTELPAQCFDDQHGDAVHTDALHAVRVCFHRSTLERVDHVTWLADWESMTEPGGPWGAFVRYR